MEKFTLFLKKPKWRYNVKVEDSIKLIMKFTKWHIFEKVVELKTLEARQEVYFIKAMCSAGINNK